MFRTKALCVAALLLQTKAHELAKPGSLRKGADGNSDGLLLQDSNEGGIAKEDYVLKSDVGISTAQSNELPSLGSSCVNLGYGCQQPQDCCSSICSGSDFKCCKAVLGVSCEHDEDCCGHSVCYGEKPWPWSTPNKICKGGVGAFCQDNSDCLGICFKEDGVKKCANCKRRGAACHVDRDCCGYGEQLAPEGCLSGVCRLVH